MSPTRSGPGLAAAARGKRTTAPQSVPELVDLEEDRPVKFTAVLDQGTVTVFERVTLAMRRVGRLAAGRYPSRADVLRAVVALVDDDPELAERVADRIRQDLGARVRRTTV